MILRVLIQLWSVCLQHYSAPEGFKGSRDRVTTDNLGMNSIDELVGGIPRLSLFCSGKRARVLVNVLQQNAEAFRHPVIMVPYGGTYFVFEFELVQTN